MSKEYEDETLEYLIELEDLAEKKAKIYSRLLMDTALAKKMEALSARHAERKSRIEALLFGETAKKKLKANDGGMCEMNKGESKK